jgi:hypothetical protein
VGLKVSAGSAAFLAASLLALLVLPLAAAGAAEDFSLEISGSCRDYNVTIALEGFGAGCYDVKVDVTTAAGRVGRIFDPREGWKSSFFYVADDFCIEAPEAPENATEGAASDETSKATRTYMLKADTPAEVLNFRGSLRHGSMTWETGYYEVVQDCPSSLPGEEDVPLFFLTILAVVAVILAGIAFHARETRK